MKQKYAMVKILMLTVLTFSTCSACSHAVLSWSSNGVREILPRSSFVKILHNYNLMVCNPFNPILCEKHTMVSSGSGSVIRRDSKDTYVLTAGHICEARNKPAYITILDQSIKLQDLFGNLHIASIVKTEYDEDVCVLKVSGTMGNLPVIPLASKPSQPGDKIFNLAAPGGFFGKNLVLLYEGFYAGDKIYGKTIMSIYAISVYPGSSGSPIINTNGELVGMIHSGYTKMNTIARGPTWKTLRDFFKKYLQ